MTASAHQVVHVERRILLLRGQRVILDSDLATLYGVSTERLNEQVRRNRNRFPPDFAFLLTRKELAILIPQFAGSSSEWGGRRKPPFAFTEHGAVMAANILRSPRAVRASIEVVRAFVRIREMLIANKDLARRLDALEAKYDSQFKVVFEAIRELMEPPPDPPDPPGRRVGFRVEE